MATRSLPTTPFGPESTAAEVLEGVELSGKRAIVTGGSSGLGVETARALAAAGAEVVLAVRDVGAGERIALAIEAATGTTSVGVRQLDLAQPASVNEFVETWSGPVHILVNNAGVMALPKLILTADGWEMQLATNHLGHFALADGLHDALAAGGARIVSLTSRGHFRSPLIFDDLNFTSRAYDPFAAYGQSKTANILFAVEAKQRWDKDGITANAVFPGVVVDTKLVRYLDPAVVENKLKSGETTPKTVAQGVATTVLAAASPLLEGVSGIYLEDCNEAPVVQEPTPHTRGGVAAYAIDPENAARLWAVSERLVGPTRVTP